MTALLKPMELVSAISSPLKTLCEANYAASILKHMWIPVCQCMGKFARAIVCQRICVFAASSTNQVTFLLSLENRLCEKVSHALLLRSCLCVL
jgi:hypothetical protein